MPTLHYYPVPSLDPKEEISSLKDILQRCEPILMQSDDRATKRLLARLRSALEGKLVKVQKSKSA